MNAFLRNKYTNQILSHYNPIRVRLNAHHEYLQLSTEDKVLFTRSLLLISNQFSSGIVPPSTNDPIFNLSDELFDSTNVYFNT